MGGFSSIYTGLSGVSANTESLSVIGNNIANQGTVGFKSSRTRFADLVRSFRGAGIGAGAAQAGSGVAIESVQTNFGQGPVVRSSSAMDWAIDGNGFFVVKNSSGNTFYTRAGQFRLNVDKQRTRIVNPTGEALQGFLADESGQIGSAVEEISLSNEMEGKATAAVSFLANLDSSKDAIGLPFDADDASTYHFSVSEGIFSEGDDTAHTLTVYFTKTDVNTWDLHARVDDGAAVAGAAPLVFNENGALDSGGTQDFTLTVPGSPDSTQSLTIDFTGTTQYGLPFASLSQSQDGYASGTLETISLGGDGMLTGRFTNQREKTIGQVGLAAFEDPTGLTRLSYELFAETGTSGAPTVLKPGDPWQEGQPAVGQIQAYSVEQSNVDLGESFVDLITTQFGIQASSRAIQSSDDLIRVTLDLKQ
jgi:flagellar hook protein FlgE